ncbi:hypothetical protein ACFY5D_21625 [Paeniglutamicibacter sp. NPDC012692]|uniref:hypothetical protein n=1 Tax=Paeniglutamicibacter sp. NPDC012692 TaxID=3364388 RepID=UPI0036AE2A2B
MSDAILSRLCDWISAENINQDWCGAVLGSLNEDVTNFGIVGCNQLSDTRRTCMPAQGMTHLSGFRNRVQVRSSGGVARSACSKSCWFGGCIFCSPVRV